MFHIITALLIFSAVAGIHIAWCRFKKSRNLQIPIFFTIFLAGIFLYAVVTENEADRSFLIQDLNFWVMPLRLSACFLYVLLSAVYLIFYFNTQVKSPTQLMLLLFKEKDFVSYSEFLVAIDNDTVIFPRIRLKDFGYISEKEGKFSLLAPGMRTAKFLALYQKLCGREIGG